MVRNPGEMMYLFIAINFLFIKKCSKMQPWSCRGIQTKSWWPLWSSNRPWTGPWWTWCSGIGLKFYIFYALQLLLKPLGWKMLPSPCKRAKGVSPYSKDMLKKNQQISFKFFVFPTFESWRHSFAKRAIDYSGLEGSLCPGINILGNIYNIDTHLYTLDWGLLTFEWLLTLFFSQVE